MRSILKFAVSAAGLAMLGLMALLAGVPAAHAQAGNRLALVVGIAEYGETKHPTAAADAGLVAETLKAAGFEVVGGANLTQGEFRALARNFLDRAQQLPRDGVVAVYLAGLGVQDEGENYFLPASARIGQRADLAIEAIRLADYLRALADLPVGARLVMVDAAYLHPLTYLAVSGGRGLGLVERTEGLLVAMNQSPGQAAGLPRTNYGHYAMALAEAFNEPGLDLEALFQRVRLRVHDLSGGSETPWHANGMATPLVLNRSAPATEASTLRGVEPPPPPSRPAIASGPEEAYAIAVEIDTIPAYEQFLRSYPDHALARKVRAVIAARREAAFWQKTRRANSPNAYWTYLRHYPRGPHAAEARRRLDRLSSSLAPPPDFVGTVYDDLPPPPPEEVVIFEDVVIEDRWEEISPPYAAPPAYLPPPPLALIEAPPPPPPSPLMKILPAVPVAVGAAILAHRVWKRPEHVRPRYAPPPPGAPGFVGRPGWGDPNRPGTPPGAIRVPPGATPPGVAVPGQPARPGAIPQPSQPPQAGIVAPPPNVQPLPPPTGPLAPRPPGQPGVAPPPAIGSPQGPPRPGTVVPLRPGQPNVAVPQFPPPARPGVGPPGQPPVVTPPAGAQPGNVVPLRPGQPNVAVPQQPGPQRPGVVPPSGGPPVVNQPPAPRPIVVRPPTPPGQPGTVNPGRPVPGAAPPVPQPPPSAAVPNRPSVPAVRPPRPLVEQPSPRGGPPAFRPPPPEYRPPQQPAFRPVPQATQPAPIVRQPPPVYRPVPQAPPPQAAPRPVPQPIVRQAPPPQAAPPPMVRQPPPQVQRQPPPPAAGCTPELRAQRRC